MKKVEILILIISFLPLLTFSQDSTSYILSGVVVDGTDNSPLAGAHLLTSKKFGTKTDTIGSFSLTIQSNDTIKISYIGFKTMKYVAPKKKNGKYLIKFKLYKDSVSLSEVEIFPYPTYKEFRKAFLAINKEHEKVKMKGVSMYTDKSRTANRPTVLSPASFIYDKLFDKKAKMRRRLSRRRKTIKQSDSDEN